MQCFFLPWLLCEMWYPESLNRYALFICQHSLHIWVTSHELGQPVSICSLPEVCKELGLCKHFKTRIQYDTRCLVDRFVLARTALSDITLFWDAALALNTANLWFCIQRKNFKSNFLCSFHLWNINCDYFYIVRKYDEYQNCFNKEN